MISKDKILTIYSTLFLIFCFSIPYEDYANAIPNILIVGLAILFPFVSKKQDLKNLKNRTYLAFITLFVFITANSFLKGQFKADFFLISKLVIPLALIFLSTPIKNFETVKKTFALATLLAVMISLFNIGEYIIQKSNTFEFTKGGFINNLLVSERLYLGFCSVISLIFLIEIFSKSYSKTIKIASGLASVLLMFFVFFVSARVAIISTLLIIVLFIVFKLNKKEKLIASLSLIVFVALFFTFNKNLKNRFFHSNYVYTESVVDKLLEREPRSIIWKCSYDIIKNNHHFLFGNGFRQTKSLLVECYHGIEKEKKRNWFIESNFNSHNQFIDFFLCSGIIGLLLFLYLLYSLFKDSTKDFMSISLLLALCLMLFIDNIFHRQIGNYFFAVICIIILNQKKQQTL